MGLTVTAALAAAWLLAAGVLRLAHRGAVLPGTTMAQLELGGSDREAARAALGRLELPQRSLVLTGAGEGADERLTVTTDDIVKLVEVV